MVILDRHKRLRDERGRIRGGNRLLTFGVRPKDDLHADLDVRKLVRRVQIALANHFSESLLQGVRPDSGRPLPKISERTRSIYQGRAGGFGVRTGQTARNWYYGRISGHAFVARGKVFASKNPQVRTLISMWLDRPDPVDIQAVDGRSAQVVEATLRDWMRDAIGDGVATERRAPIEQGSIGNL